MSETKIQNLVTGAIAVMFGFVAYKIIQIQFFGKTGNNGGGMIASNESMSGAQGTPCGANGAPSTYMEGSAGCDFLHDCENKGGTPIVTNYGGSYGLKCGGSQMTTTSSGSSTTLVAKQRRSFF